MSEQNKLSLMLAIFTAFLAFFGALGGSVISGHFNKNLWQEQMSYEQAKEIIKLRINLVKEVSILANQAPVIDGYQSYIKLQAGIASDFVACKKAKLSSCEEPDDVKTVLEINNKKAELTAKYASTLQLVTLYFGPNTKIATNELAKMQPWWKVGEQGFRKLMNSMNNEIYYQITHNHAINPDS